MLHFSKYIVELICMQFFTLSTHIIESYISIIIEEDKRKGKDNDQCK